MAIGICKCKRTCVKHDSGAHTFKWLCDECRADIQKKVLESNKPVTLKDKFNRVLKRSA